MTSTATHRCLIGFDYEPKRGNASRFEPGDTIIGVPTKTLAELVEADAAERITDDAEGDA